MRYPSDDRGSVSLWVSLAAPVIILLFFFFYLGIMVQGQASQQVQRAGDFATLAAAGDLDPAEMLAGRIVFDENAAAQDARDYLAANYEGASLVTLLTTDELFANGLTLDSSNRVIGDTDGAVVRFLYPGEDVNPLTGEYADRPLVLLAVRVTLSLPFNGTKTYVTYSLASPR